MKKFDMYMINTIAKFNGMDSLNKVNWKKLTSKLFDSSIVPKRYKGIVIENKKQWDRFVTCYCMDKMRVNSRWINLELKRLKPINEDVLDMNDILSDALKEIGKGKI